MFLLLQLLNKGSLKPAGCPFSSDKQQDKQAYTSVDCPFSKKDSYREGFEQFLTKVTQKDSIEHKEMLQKLQKMFYLSDENQNGQIEREEFDTLIEYTSEDVRNSGFVPLMSEVFTNDVNKFKSWRDHLFAQMKGSNQHINFEAYQKWVFEHIEGKLHFLRHRTTESDQLQASKILGQFKDAALGKVDWEVALEGHRDIFVKASKNGKLPKDSFLLFLSMLQEPFRVYGVDAPLNQIYNNGFELLQHREKTFNQISEGQDFITWEKFKLWDISQLSEKFAGAKNLCPFSMDDAKRAGFKKQLKAMSDTDSNEYKQFIVELQRMFLTADENQNGEIEREEFDTLVEFVAEDARRHGFVPLMSQIFSNDINKFKKWRDDLFIEMKKGKQTLDFECFKDWTITHVKGKVDAGLNTRTSAEDKASALAFIDGLKKGVTGAESWEKVLKPYENIFSDCAEYGSVPRSKFNYLVEMLAEKPRAYGVIPPISQMYNSAYDMMNTRDKLFTKISGGKSNITWVQFKVWLIDHLKGKIDY